MEYTTHTTVALDSLKVVDESVALDGTVFGDVECSVEDGRFFAEATVTRVEGTVFLPDGSERPLVMEDLDRYLDDPDGLPARLEEAVA